jgi:transglutaminase-like putative cysteine protease
MIRVALHHKTVYQYDRPVTLSPQVVRLRPAPHSRTPIPSYSLRIEPASHFINWQQDPQGNFQARLAFPEPTTRFSLEVDLVAEMTVLNPFDFFLEPDAEHVPFRYDELLRRELAPYLDVAPAGPHLSAFLASITREPTATITFLVDLNQRLQGDVRYLIRMEPGVQASEETLERGSGSCRDSAWLLVETKSRSKGRKGRPPTSPISMRGPRCICPVPAGSASIRPRGSSPAKDTSRWRRRRRPSRPRPCLDW